jgi:hypothetical protein
MKRTPRPYSTNDIIALDRRGTSRTCYLVADKFGIANCQMLPIKCLDLTFLIDAEDKGSVRRGQVKADDVADLVDEQRIARQLECLATV